MRLDSFPEDGNFPGSDPDLAFKHVIMEAGCDLVVLEPFGATGITPELAHSKAVAINHWLDNHWLDSKNNWHERWRGSITVAIEDPQWPRSRRSSSWAATR